MATVIDQQTRPSGDAIDTYIRSLAYRPEELLAVPADGATESFVPTTRTDNGNRVVVVTKTHHSLTTNLTEVALLQPTGGVVYPGALLLADTRLAEGKPVPLALPQAPLSLSVDLPGLATSRRVVANPSHSSVQQAITELLEEWHRGAARDGYVNAARSFLQVKTAYSSQQVALELGFNAKWAAGNASAQLKVDSSGQTSSVVAYFKQVFYTVTVDTPARPSAVFDPAVTLEQVRQQSDARHAPAYVRSVDYGRVLLLRMETSAQETRVNLQGALQQVTGGAELGGSIDAKYAAIVRNATFTVVAIGGSAQAAASFTGSESDLKRLREYLRQDATYRRDNPGAPIAYTVAYLKDNGIASMSFATSYIETASVTYPNGFVKFRHEGGYVAAFRVTWDEADAQGKYHNRQWDSGNTSLGWQQQLNLPGDARNIRLQAWAMTGIDSWNEALNKGLDGPDNKCYKVYGTVWGPAWNNDC